MRQIVVTLYKAKETMNTVVYKAETGAVLPVPQIYVAKFGFLDGESRPAYPDAIRVTVDEVS